MKKLLSITMMLTLSSCASAGFNGNNSPSMAAKNTVAQALSAKRDNTPVQITGKIIRQIDGDEFIFRDSTGEIKIDVEDEAWQGLNVNPNETITIFGEVDHDNFEKNSIEVHRIQK